MTMNEREACAIGTALYLWLDEAQEWLYALPEPEQERAAQIAWDVKTIFERMTGQTLDETRQKVGDSLAPLLPDDDEGDGPKPAFS